MLPRLRGSFILDGLYVAPTASGSLRSSLVLLHVIPSFDIITGDPALSSCMMCVLFVLVSVFVVLSVLGIVCVLLSIVVVDVSPLVVVLFVLVMLVLSILVVVVLSIFVVVV